MDPIAIIRQLVDVLRRSDPEYVESHEGAEQCTDDEWDDALEAAEDFLEEHGS